MNMVLWILAGSLLGWAGIAHLKYNQARGLIVSIIIGGAGGLLGGNVLAPMVGVSAAVSGELGVGALLVAAASAAACLVAADMVHTRFGV